MGKLIYKKNLDKKNIKENQKEFHKTKKTC